MGMELIQLAEERNKCPTPTNTVIKVSVSLHAENFLTISEIIC